MVVLIAITFSLFIGFIAMCFQAYNLFAKVNELQESLNLKQISLEGFIRALEDKNTKYIELENAYKYLSDVYEKTAQSGFDVNSLSRLEKECYYRIAYLCKKIIEESENKI